MYIGFSANSISKFKQYVFVSFNIVSTSILSFVSNNIEKILLRSRITD
ncbi:hypothetical protein JM79_1328 [Gramella sp. Hel_I_59]|nr:hypothetical protein JM79_1328 [Gramella sp. Hel_I_59]